MLLFFCKFYAMKNNHIHLGNASIFHLFIDEIFAFLLCNKNKIRRIITSFRVPDHFLSSTRKVAFIRGL